MFTGSQDLYLRVYTDLIIGNWEKVLNHMFQVLTGLINHYVSEILLISHFSFLIALLSVFLKTYFYATMSLIKILPASDLIF